MEELFEEEQQTEINVLGSPGTEITLSEITHALTMLTNIKAPGLDNIKAEILKLLKEDQLKLPINLLNKIYETGELPKD